MNNGDNGGVPSNVEFQTFHSRVWDYLVGIHDKRARLFGLRYLEFLQARHRGFVMAQSPKPLTPADRIVQRELLRIYREHYRTNLDLSGVEAGAA